MQQLKNLTVGNNSDEIHKAVEALNHATESFAAKRMDASVKQAFAGQDLNKLEL
jgi:molecular chaperone HscA